MNTRQTQNDLDYLMQRASEQLGAPVRPLQLVCELATSLIRAAWRVEVRGIGGEAPVRMVHTGLVGYSVAFGMERYTVDVNGRRIPFVRVLNQDGTSLLEDLFFVPAADLRRLYRWLRRGHRERVRGMEPIMRDEDRKALWDNTIGFLVRGAEALERFGVPLKRGVLLMGEPGNGKTMAARWLYAEALKANLEWRTVTVAQFDCARSNGTLEHLFQLNRPGLVLFDDFDTGLRDREETGMTRDHSTFLSELDGVSLRSGIVYLFTTNARFRDLDAAFRRPGRIDRIITFPKPDAELRRRLVLEHWPAEIVAAIPVDELINETEGLCFAEVEELKKLLVLRYLDTRNWDWPWAWTQFRERIRDCEKSRPLGFVCANAGRDW